MSGQGLGQQSSAKNPDPVHPDPIHPGQRAPVTGIPTGAVDQQEELQLVRLLREGDELAFTTLIDRYHTSMVRLARSYVESEAAAEDVAGDTWLAVIRGLERFEGRSTFKTWLFRILVNRARTSGTRESRSVPFSWLEEDVYSTIDPDRFLDEGSRWAGAWAAPPRPWSVGPEGSIENAQLRGAIGRALDQLPTNQQTVVTLRDVHAFTADEVCQILGVSAANQRVLLHRGRAKLRLVLESVFEIG